MGFDTILNRWRRSGRDADADNASTALATFHDRHPQVYENLDVDGQILQAKREELLQQVILVAPDQLEVVEGKILGFCRSNQCCGRPNSTAQRAALGHVEERGKTEKTLESTAFAKSRLARRNRRSILFLDGLLASDLAGQRGQLSGTRLARFIMWSFYQPRKLSTPFDGVSKRQKELIRRLGLRLADRDEEFLLWEHTLEPHQTAHRPTAFDAEAYDSFRLGGKTRPLSGKNDGLHEVVHPPVLGDQLAAKIELAT